MHIHDFIDSHEGIDSEIKFEKNKSKSKHKTFLKIDAVVALLIIAVEAILLLFY